MEHPESSSESFDAALLFPVDGVDGGSAEDDADEDSSVRIDEEPAGSPRKFPDLEKEEEENSPEFESELDPLQEELDPLDELPPGEDTFVVVVGRGRDFTRRLDEQDGKFVWSVRVETVVGRTTPTGNEAACGGTTELEGVVTASWKEAVD